MQQLTDSLRSLTTTALGTLGMLVVISLSAIPLVTLVPVGFLQAFALPGRFLFASFHAASAFIPVYLIAAASMVRRGSGASAILALNLSILPFLTLAVAFRLGFDARVSASPVTAGVEQMLGRSQGAVSFALLTALLTVLVLAVLYMWSRFDRAPSDSDSDRKNSEADVSDAREVLELPAPAAAFAWRFTPRGKARAAAGASNDAVAESGGDPNSAYPRASRTDADAEPAEAGGSRSAWAAGASDDDDVLYVPDGRDGYDKASAENARRDGEEPEEDTGDSLELDSDDIPPVVRSRRSSSVDASDDGVGLQIAWPGGRSRVQFDDDISGFDEHAEPSEPDRYRAEASSSAEADDRLIVEFRDGRFHSVDSEGDEVLLGFSTPDAVEEATHEDFGETSPIEELEAVGEEFDYDEEAQDEYAADRAWDSDADEAWESDGNEAWDSDADEAWDGDGNEAWDGDADRAWDSDAEEAWDGDADRAWDSDADESAEGIEDPAEYSADEADGRQPYAEAQAGAAQPDAGSSGVPDKKKSGRRKKTRYSVPVEGLLHEYPNERYWELDERTKRDGETLRYTLQEFGIEAEVTGIRKGPVITMYEILPAPGVKLTKIVNLADNIALRLAAQTVRIVAPIPGKHAVGIEVPNKRRAIVSFADLVQQPGFTDKDHSIPMAIGKDIPGDAQIIDLAKTPHLLIAGATGSGKSVCVNSIICSILYRRPPEDVKMILIDPKIVELKFYNDIPHLLTPVITEPKRAFQALQWALYEMERRYSLLDSLQVRDIKSYNQKVKARKLATETLPYLVIVVDEFADLMATSGKELESTLARLAAMSRAVGIHLVLATQRPSTDVITGLIKANIPSRIAFMVASKVDSRIILDSQGAEKLLGRGDMLFTSAWDPAPIRMQGAFLSEDEVERVVNHVKTLGEPEYIDDEIFIDDEEDPDLQENLEDPLMEKAISVVQQSRKASASYLQRRLKIGYNRAARMVEEMERLGIVGPSNGSKPREILRNEAVGVGE
ncbi:MAG: DNA translocase FtsK [Spirochaetales bacterium]